MSKKAEVLIRLLDKVPDSNKLQRLLEPENLLYLLQQYGYQRDDLQQRLKNGTLPGELLLELLEQEPDSEYLLVMLSNTMDTKVEKRVVIDEIIRQKKEEEDALKARSTVPSQRISSAQGASSLPLMPPASVSDQGASLFEQPLIRVASVVVTLTAILPALMYSGFFSNLNVIPSPIIAMIITVIGGAIAGMLLSRATASAPWKGIMIGILLNVGVLGATIIYSQSRTKLYSVEILLPLVIGSLPAGLLYLILIGRRTF